jgi:hypothetical protein
MTSNDVVSTVHQSHVTTRILDTRFLSSTASYDVASTVYQALCTGFLLVRGVLGAGETAWRGLGPDGMGWGERGEFGELGGFGGCGADKGHRGWSEVGAYTRPLFSSTSAAFDTYCTQGAQRIPLKVLTSSRNVEGWKTLELGCCEGASKSNVQ